MLCNQYAGTCLFGRGGRVVVAWVLVAIEDTEGVTADASVVCVMLLVVLVTAAAEIACCSLIVQVDFWLIDGRPSLEQHLCNCERVIDDKVVVCNQVIVAA